MKLHLIANSHIDPVWLWDKYEGIDEVLNTFRSACDRLDEFPDLSFTASSLQFYAWCRDYDTVLFERIQAHVASGRWEVVGNWWIEPDSNLPLEASVRRQHAVSSRFLDEHFGGLRSEVAFLPDTFGHPATLPRLLSDLRQKYFLFCRPGEHEKDDLPANLFYWEHDGARVLAYRLKHHYTQPRSLDDRAFFDRLTDAEYEYRDANAFLFGVGNHGGGPTIAEIERCRRFILGRPDGEAGFSTCADFFAEAEKLPDIPTYSGDLHRHAVGCYSVLREMKHRIRSCEHGLGFAERAAAISAVSPDPVEPLWRTTLFNQFHDILPGSCSPAAADMARAEMGGVEDGWRNLAYDALKVLSATRPVRCPRGEFRVFNTLPFEVTVPLHVESFQYFVPGADFLDGRGEVVQIQEVLPSVRCNNRRWEFVDTIPARGFNTYSFHAEGAEEARSPSTVHYVPGDRIATPGLAVDGDGFVTDADGKGLLNPIAFRVLRDTSDTWGHGVVRYDDDIGNFERQSTAVLEGPVTRRLFQRWVFDRSHIDVVYAIYSGLPFADVAVTVDWAEDRRILKMEMVPGGRMSGACLMQGPGGAIGRPADGAEQPLHHWVTVRGPEGAFAVVQDGAFAADATGARLRITLVRSNLYGYHDPNVLDPHDPQHRTDQGLHTFRFRLYFEKTVEPAELDRSAAAFLEPYWVVRESGGRP